MTAESPDDLVAIVTAGAAAMEAALAEDSWCHVVTTQRRLEWAEILDDSPAVVRRLRGRLMGTWDAFEAEVSVALQFPEYYESFRNAFDECLETLEWLPTEVGYVLLVTQPELVLAGEASADLGRPAEHLRRLVTLLARCAETYAVPVDLGEDWDRPALRFDVVLLPSPEEEARVRYLWQQAGAPVG